jgi:CelD/BcsL family acetyltransferase involved in cellulose biosynthesis
LSTRPSKLLRTKVLRSAQEFAALEEEWEDLYHDSPQATPFQSWAWLYSWWEYYGEGYELRLITVWEGAVMVGLVPLMLRRRWGFGRLLFIGTGITDYLDILARQEWEDRVSEAGRRALWQMDRWHVVDLQQLCPEAAAWSIFKDWLGPRTYIWQDSTPTMDVKPWDEVLKSVNRKLRSNFRRTLRRAEADGLHAELASVDDVEQATYNMVVLHREAWRGRDIAPEHLTRRFEAHLQAAARRMTAHGLGGVSEFWCKGEAIASHLVVFGRDSVAQVLFGVRQDVLQRYQMYSLYTKDMVDMALRRNLSSVNWGRGDELYKLRWTSKVFSTRRVIMGRSLALWAPYVGYLVLNSKVRSYANSEGAPRWIKRAVGRYRALRSALARRL